MPKLHSSNSKLPHDLVAALAASGAIDPWLLFQEGYCKTQLMKYLTGQNYAFFESSNDHKKFWKIDAGSQVKQPKPPGTVSGSKPDLRVFWQGNQQHVATVEIKVRPDFGASAQIKAPYLLADVMSLYGQSTQVFLLGSTDAWWKTIVTAFPGLYPNVVHTQPTVSSQSFNGHQFHCTAMQASPASPVAAAWTLP